MFYHSNPRPRRSKAPGHNFVEQAFPSETDNLLSAAEQKDHSYVFSENQMPAVENAFRDQDEADFWYPFLETLTDAEMEKIRIQGRKENVETGEMLANGEMFGGWKIPILYKTSYYICNFGMDSISI